MAGDDLDLSEFEEFSSTAKERSRRSSPGKGRGGGTGGEGSGGRRRWPWFLTGLVLGGVIAVLGPDLAAPYLPPILRPGGEEVRGPVVGKRVGNDRVLLTVDTERGALLATFRQRVPEIDLLVEEGDTVTLGIPEYAPLIEDPVLSAVRKGGGVPGRTDGAVGGPGRPATRTPEGEPPDGVGGQAAEEDGVSPPDEDAGSAGGGSPPDSGASATPGN